LADGRADLWDPDPRKYQKKEEKKRFPIGERSLGGTPNTEMVPREQTERREWRSSRTSGEAFSEISVKSKAGREYGEDKLA